MKTKETKSVRLNLRITSELYEGLRAIAKSSEMSVSELVRLGIRWAIKTYGKNGETN
jgi:predicted HicB family RNase H-like nuclease